MGLKRRVEKLERAIPGGCAGCAPRQTTWHYEYLLPDGEKLLIPPWPASRPPCTCGPRRLPRGIDCFILHAGAIESRDAAERMHACNRPTATPRD